MIFSTVYSPEALVFALYAVMEILWFNTLHVSCEHLKENINRTIANQIPLIVHEQASTKQSARPLANFTPWVGVLKEDLNPSAFHYPSVKLLPGCEMDAQTFNLNTDTYKVTRRAG